MDKLIPLFFVVLVLVVVGSGCESMSGGDAWTRPADELVMVQVPEGESQMGDAGGPRIPDSRSDRQPLVVERVLVCCDFPT